MPAYLTASDEADLPALGRLDEFGDAFNARRRPGHIN
jgi:hypothetical protein